MGRALHAGRRIALAALLMGAAACASVPDGVTTWVESPSPVQLGERFTIRAHVRNTAQEPVRLRSLDIGESYLEGIEIHGSRPRFVSLVRLPIDDTMSYGFELDVPAGDHLVVEFSAEAKKLGVHQGDFDLCVNSQVNCSFQTITTPVVAAP